MTRAHQKFVAPKTFCRNIAEAIHALYANTAPPRDEERMLQLVEQQVDRAYRIGRREVDSEEAAAQ